MKHPDEVNAPSVRTGATDEELLASRKNHFLPLALYHDKPLHLKKGQGVYVWDADGNRYLDCIGGIICISAGHNHPKIKQKIQQMLDDDELQHIGHQHRPQAADHRVADHNESEDEDRDVELRA